MGLAYPRAVQDWEASISLSTILPPGQTGVNKLLAHDAGLVNPRTTNPRSSWMLEPRFRDSRNATFAPTSSSATGVCGSIRHLPNGNARYMAIEIMDFDPGDAAWDTAQRLPSSTSYRCLRGQNTPRMGHLEHIYLSSAALSLDSPWFRKDLGRCCLHDQDAPVERLNKISLRNLLAQLTE